MITTCPSCQSLIWSRVEVCAHCGYEQRQKQTEPSGVLTLSELASLAQTGRKYVVKLKRTWSIGRELKA